jgi:hypothetical protein
MTAPDSRTQSVRVELTCADALVSRPSPPDAPDPPGVGSYFAGPYLAVGDPMGSKPLMPADGPRHAVKTVTVAYERDGVEVATFVLDADQLRKIALGAQLLAAQLDGN